METVKENTSLLPVTMETESESKRDYNHAVLYSCDALQFDLTQQKKAIKFVDVINLCPVSIISDDGTKKKSLIHKNLGLKICSKKRKLDGDSTLQIIPELQLRTEWKSLQWQLIQTTQN